MAPPQQTAEQRQPPMAELRLPMAEQPQPLAEPRQPAARRLRPLAEPPAVPGVAVAAAAAATRPGAAIAGCYAAPVP